MFEQFILDLINLQYLKEKNIIVIFIFKKHTFFIRHFYVYK